MKSPPQERPATGSWSGYIPEGIDRLWLYFELCDRVSLWRDRGSGGPERMTLRRSGPSPLLTLAEVRDKARTFKASTKRGVDPAVEAKREAAAANTFGKAVERYMARSWQHRMYDLIRRLPLADQNL
jgi:hypothetical protein